MDEQRLLRLLGLGLRGRLVVVGVEQVRAAAQKGTLALAVVAPDASRHSLDKVVPLLRAKGIRFVEGPGARELGNAVGKEATAVVGVVDEKLARGLRAIVESAAEGAPPERETRPERRQD